MQKIYLLTFLVTTLVSPLSSARADGPAIQEQSVTAVVPIPCAPNSPDALDAYQAEVDRIQHFGKKAALAVAIPAAPLAFLILASVSGGGGGASGPIDGGAAAIIFGGAGIAAADFGIIKGVKHIQSRHDREVVRNIQEMQVPGTDGNKSIDHTTDLINDKLEPSTRYTPEEIAQALSDAVGAGDLCKDGKLVVTGDFREAIIRHLARKP